MATATADRSRSIRFCKGCSKASCKRKHSARLSTQRTERRRKRRAQKNECVSFPDAAHAPEPSRRRALVDELAPPPPPPPPPPTPSAPQTTLHPRPPPS